jgi:gas vesicle protein
MHMYTEHDRGEYGTGGFMAGLLCGAAVGAALGMAFAPRSGVEMRRQIAHSSERLRQGAKSKYEQASGRVGGLVSRSREAMERHREGTGGTDTTTGETRPTTPPYSSQSYPSV